MRRHQSGGHVLAREQWQGAHFHQCLACGVRVQRAHAGHAAVERDKQVESAELGSASSQKSAANRRGRRVPDRFTESSVIHHVIHEGPESRSYAVQDRIGSRCPL
jgi:hypothetical protein